MQSPESSFLHDRNPQMHASDEVEAVEGYLRRGGESVPSEPAYKILAYDKVVSLEETPSQSMPEYLQVIPRSRRALTGDLNDTVIHKPSFRLVKR